MSPSAAVPALPEARIDPSGDPRLSTAPDPSPGAAAPAPAVEGAAARARAAKIDEYDRLAFAAAALAEGSLLANVRVKHEVAADRWRALAALTAAPMSPRPRP